MILLRVILIATFTLFLASCGSNSENPLFSNDSPENTVVDVDPEISLLTKLRGADQIILEAPEDRLGAIASEIGKQGGNVVREMEFVSALVANVPEQALHGLQKKFPEITFYPDLAVELIHPFKKPSGTPGGGKGEEDNNTQPNQSTPWSLTRIGAISAHATTKGAGEKVCVVDTGISKDHPDLADNIIGGRNFVFAKGKIDPAGWDDDNGHGSHVAGTIAALDNSIGTIGVAPEAKLIGVKVLDKRGSGSLSGVTDGIYECIFQSASIINMSLGATSDPDLDSPMKTAIQAAVNAGIIVVTAAGNEGQSIENTIPSGYTTTIAVSATDSNDNFPYWSNFGLTILDYAAPGVSIYSTWKGSEYNTISGTSMAAPHVAGALALALSVGRDTLTTTDLGESVSVQGKGLIDADTSVK